MALFQLETGRILCVPITFILLSYHLLTTIISLCFRYLVIIWLLFGDSATHTLPISTFRAPAVLLCSYRGAASRSIICSVYPLCILGM